MLARYNLAPHTAGKCTIAPAADTRPAAREWCLLYGLGIERQNNPWWKILLTL